MAFCLTKHLAIKAASAVAPKGYGAFAELVLWRVPTPVTGSRHGFKYRLAYVVGGTCVVRYDNESGKGDHRHFNTRERPYTFETPEQLIADFQADMARWNRENRHS